jgi:hypothetical protein
MNSVSLASEPCYEDYEVFLLPYSTGGKDAAISQTQAVPDEHDLCNRRFNSAFSKGGSKSGGDDVV